MRGLGAGANVAAVAAAGAGGPGEALHAGGPSGGLSGGFVGGDGPGAGADKATMAVAVAGGLGGALDAEGLIGGTVGGRTPRGGTQVAGHSDQGAPGVAEGQKGVAAWSAGECKDSADAEPQALQVHLLAYCQGCLASATAWAVLDWFSTRTHSRCKRSWGRIGSGTACAPCVVACTEAVMWL